MSLRIVMVASLMLLALVACPTRPAWGFCAICVDMDACSARATEGGVCVVRCENGICNCGQAGSLCNFGIVPDDMRLAGGFVVFSLFAADAEAANRIVGTGRESRVLPLGEPVRGPVDMVAAIQRVVGAPAGRLEHIQTVSALGHELANFASEVGDGASIVIGFTDVGHAMTIATGATSPGTQRLETMRILVGPREALARRLVLLGRIYILTAAVTPIGLDGLAAPRLEHFQREASRQAKHFASGAGGR